LNSNCSDPTGPTDLPRDLAEAIGRVRARPGAFGSPLAFFHAIGSTNDEAARLAALGAGEGTTVVAEAQTSGRGRLGRAWFSPPGTGLYLSVVLRPGPDRAMDRAAESAVPPAGAATPLPALLTLMAGVAVCEAVRETTGLPADIKWPNDLVCGRRKLAGILAEAGATFGGAGYVVVGIGINVRRVAYPREIVARATSIEEELGRRVDRGDLLARVLSKVADCRTALREGRVDEVLDRWRCLAPTSVGAEVEWQTADRARRGTTAGLDRDGALLVRVGDRIERIVAGEINWE
jgi:BirA family biotin operon repressor/biotin-[acetyl-CoA-carboxylase] ligase